MQVKKIVATAGALGLAGAGIASANDGAQAQDAAWNSPGVLSRNVIQVPVYVPVNVCGNTINVIGLLNPGFGNHCEKN